jgi:citronellol/citronellal dehydrogenase
VGVILGLGDRSQWRSPEILCHGMMEILRLEPPVLTGQQILDELFLCERGWSDEQIDACWLEGKPPEHPVVIGRRTGSVM